MSRQTCPIHTSQTLGLVTAASWSGWLRLVKLFAPRARGAGYRTSEPTVGRRRTLTAKLFEPSQLPGTFSNAKEYQANGSICLIAGLP
eukprot:4564867-Amphidinium_carterae.1